MKTDELIRAIAADGRRSPSVAAVLLRYLPVAVALAALAMVATAGLRPDLRDALLGSPWPGFKLLASLGLGVSGTGLALRLARPGAGAGAWRRSLVALAVVVAGAVIVELRLLSPGEWRAATLGTNAVHCLMLIPALALAPLAAALMALRRGAPDRPALAGAAAGLLASGFGATLYALHCPDDSPLFVATWYGLGIAAITACGAAAGSKLLRW
jgi:hypothetical protein